MNILVVLAHSYIPQYSGGVESSTHELAIELSRRGHDVNVLCKLDPRGFSGLKIRAMRRLSGKPYARDTGLGYPVYRAWDVPDVMMSAVEELCPDVILIQNWVSAQMVRELERIKIPAMIYLRNVEIAEQGVDLAALRGIRFIANSKFTARRYKDHFGIDAAVIPPLFLPQQYCGQRKPSNVTLVNPHPLKGGTLAFKIAQQCGEIPFHFVQSWTLTPEQRTHLAEQMKTVKNVTLVNRTRSMKPVYSRAKIVLMPSKWEEAWGRVASEAHFSGIPVVASDIGGLPESVGPGGILLDPDGPLESWVVAIRRLWSDSAFYREKSEAALAFSKRPELDPARQIDQLLAVAHQAVELWPQRRSDHA